MRFSLLENDNISISRWNEYVKENKKCGIYHTFQFLRYISNYFNLEIYLFCVEEAGKIVGILPMHRTKAFPYGTQLVSNAFSGSFGGMCTDNNEISKYLIRGLTNYVSGMNIRYAEIRSDNENNYNLPFYDIYVNYNLSLSCKIDEIWTNKISSKTRNQIRRSLKSKLTWRICKKEGINLFYDVYEKTMIQLGSPFFKLDFFQGLMNNFNENMFIAIVEYEGMPISALWMVKSKNKIYNPWAGLIRSHSDLCPNNLNYWKSICWSHESRANEFDFGRSINNSGQEKFKKGWGGLKTKLHYHYILNNNEKIPEINPTNKRIAMLSKAWRVLPLSLKRVATGALISRVP